MEQFAKRCHRLSQPENTGVLLKVATWTTGLKQKWLAKAPVRV